MSQISQPHQKSWYENWFDTHYLDLYANRDSRDAEKQLDLLTKTLPLKKRTPQTPGSTILDIGCGYGRHVSLLLKRGYAASGIDLSPTLIQHGRKTTPKLPIAIGDMRTLTKTEKLNSYTLLLSLFTSFGYFSSKRTHIEVLQAMSHILKRGGWLWLDFLNTAYITRFLKPETTTLTNGKFFHEKRRIEKGRIIKDIYVTLPQTEPSTPKPSSSQEDKQPLHYQESVALYTLDELLAMGKIAQFTHTHIFGDYTGSPFTKDSPRTLIVFQKK